MSADKSGLPLPNMEPALLSHSTSSVPISNAAQIDHTAAHQQPAALSINTPAWSFSELEGLFNTEVSDNSDNEGTPINRAPPPSPATSSFVGTEQFHLQHLHYHAGRVSFHVNQLYSPVLSASPQQHVQVSLAPRVLQASLSGSFHEAANSLNQPKVGNNFKGKTPDRLNVSGLAGALISGQPPHFIQGHGTVTGPPPAFGGPSLLGLPLGMGLHAPMGGNAAMFMPPGLLPGFGHGLQPAFPRGMGIPPVMGGPPVYQQPAPSTHLADPQAQFINAHLSANALQMALRQAVNERNKAEERASAAQSQLASLVVHGHHTGPIQEAVKESKKIETILTQSRERAMNAEERAESAKAETEILKVELANLKEELDRADRSEAEIMELKAQFELQADLHDNARSRASNAEFELVQLEIDLRAANDQLRSLRQKFVKEHASAKEGLITLQESARMSEERARIAEEDLTANRLEMADFVEKMKTVEKEDSTSTTKLMDSNEAIISQNAKEIRLLHQIIQEDQQIIYELKQKLSIIATEKELTANVLNSTITQFSNDGFDNWISSAAKDDTDINTEAGRERTRRMLEGLAMTPSLEAQNQTSTQADIGESSNSGQKDILDLRNSIAMQGSNIMASAIEEFTGWSPNSSGEQVTISGSQQVVGDVSAEVPTSSRHRLLLDRDVFRFENGVIRFNGLSRGRWMHAKHS